jgi:hypothetical protein
MADIITSMLCKRLVLAAASNLRAASSNHCLAVN